MLWSSHTEKLTSVAALRQVDGDLTADTPGGAYNEGDML